MSTWLVVLITALYAFASIDLFAKGQWQMGVVYAGYAFANIGLIALMLAVPESGTSMP